MNGPAGIRVVRTADPAAERMGDVESASGSTGRRYTSHHEDARAVIGREAIERRLTRRGLAGRWVGSPPEVLAGIADDSRRVSHGELFCAIPGTRLDGRDFLEAAHGSGAAAAVVERPDPSCSLPQLVVPDVRAAASHLASLFHGDPGEALDAVGVTGTNGKTTTVWLLRHLLGARHPAASIGTLGVIRPDGRREAGALTTPGPVELMERLADLRDGGAGYVALEISSHALDQHRTDGLALAAGVFTNLSREHLDYHVDMDSYRRAKLRMASLVRPGGVCVVNADEPAWSELEPGEARRLTFGVSDAADVRAVDIEHSLGGSRWTMTYQGGRVPVELPLPGGFNIYNALGAAAAAVALVLRDYAHTPVAFERVLDALRPEDGRLLLVFGCGGDRDAGKRPLMGHVAAERADLVFLTTDNPRSEDPAEIVREIERGMNGAPHRVVMDRREAIAAALAEARPGDVVLLAGKGHETYQVLGERREPFDEAGIVAELTGAGLREAGS